MASVAYGFKGVIGPQFVGAIPYVERATGAEPVVTMIHLSNAVLNSSLPVSVGSGSPAGNLGLRSRVTATIAWAVGANQWARAFVYKWIGSRNGQTRATRIGPYESALAYSEKYLSDSPQCATLVAAGVNASELAKVLASLLVQLGLANPHTGYSLVQSYESLVSRPDEIAHSAIRATLEKPYSLDGILSSTMAHQERATLEFEEAVIAFGIHVGKQYQETSRALLVLHRAFGLASLWMQGGWPEDLAGQDVAFDSLKGVLNLLMYPVQTSRPTTDQLEMIAAELPMLWALAQTGTLPLVFRAPNNFIGNFTRLGILDPDDPDRLLMSVLARADENAVAAGAAKVISVIRDITPGLAQFTRMGENYVPSATAVLNALIGCVPWSAISVLADLASDLDIEQACLHARVPAIEAAAYALCHVQTVIATSTKSGVNWQYHFNATSRVTEADRAIVTGVGTSGPASTPSPRNVLLFVKPDAGGGATLEFPRGDGVVGLLSMRGAPQSVVLGLDTLARAKLTPTSDALGSVVGASASASFKVKVNAADIAPPVLLATLGTTIEFSYTPAMMLGVPEHSEGDIMIAPRLAYGMETQSYLAVLFASIVETANSTGPLTGLTIPGKAKAVGLRGYRGTTKHESPSDLLTRTISSLEVDDSIAAAGLPGVAADRAQTVQRIYDQAAISIICSPATRVALGAIFAANSHVVGMQIPPTVGRPNATRYYEAARALIVDQLARILPTSVMTKHLSDAAARHTTREAAVTILSNQR